MNYLYPLSFAVTAPSHRRKRLRHPLISLVPTPHMSKTRPGEVTGENAMPFFGQFLQYLSTRLCCLFEISIETHTPFRMRQQYHMIMCSIPHVDDGFVAGSDRE